MHVLKRYSFFIAAILLLSTCGGETGPFKNPRGKADRCITCNYKAAVIKSIPDETNPTTLINTPQAFEFWNLVCMISKYDNEEKRDSLPPVLQSEGRQEIYRTLDQFGMFGAFVKPQLDSLKIPLFEPAIPDHTLYFQVADKPYQVDLNYFLDHDGVILFTPGKLPVLWNLDAASPSCPDADFIRGYYK